MLEGTHQTRSKAFIKSGEIGGKSQRKLFYFMNTLRHSPTRHCLSSTLHTGSLVVWTRLHKEVMGRIQFLLLCCSPTMMQCFSTSEQNKVRLHLHYSWCAPSGLQWAPILLAFRSLHLLPAWLVCRPPTLSHDKLSSSITSPASPAALQFTPIFLIIQLSMGENLLVPFPFFPPLFLPQTLLPCNPLLWIVRLSCKSPLLPCKF